MKRFPERCLFIFKTEIFPLLGDFFMGDIDKKVVIFIYFAVLFSLQNYIYMHNHMHLRSLDD